MSRPVTAPHAVYRIFDAEGGLLYIGTSPNPMNRMHDHASRKVWATRIASVRVEWFTNKADAMAAEITAIAAEGPEWNVHHRAPRCPHTMTAAMRAKVLSAYEGTGQ